MSQSKSRGIFVSFEGIDGSGKSTQARMLADRLRMAGHEIIATREPGGSPGAEEIRRLLVEGDPARWSAETELLLFTAARRDHFERTIGPALELGKTVITDRFADSTRVYQGTTRGDLRALVDQLHSMMIKREPDVTFIIDMDPATALRRTKGRDMEESRFEEFGLPFQRKLRDGFRELADQEQNRCILIDGTGTASAVAGRVMSAWDQRYS
ncbi:dTMP kinase [Qingshengfaniella alkalisoli]|uniref:Thymidylate kinase n=1 Tax=Qingshengfaniella alkalisoli TaxID=2599296 RepID=A0A5B8IQF6_9RHOB|nr:dTMP kinase [Qingshengfaniella alkalisoli]QDY68482.1 dTMP kinase [Qingshengfaniella alkalisoli]